jgi:hypothetical protein
MQAASRRLEMQAITAAAIGGCFLNICMGVKQ